jgi:hypothetical protein
LVPTAAYEDVPAQAEEKSSTTSEIETDTDNPFF